MSDQDFLNDLPKQYDHAAAQSKWYPFWEERGYFHSEPNPDRQPYTIVIPPPNVTGALHLGHALNNTLQDILIRQKRMQGFETLWMPGTDHAGIATQAVVERRLFEEEKKTRHDLGREGLVERIWEWKDAYEKRILGQLKEMGCSCDWERTRFTLDPVCARAVRHTFFSLFKDELIYRGNRLVNWDTHLQTAVADDEVFHKSVPGHFWHFRYPVIDPQPGEPTHVTIATTRPETMLGDTAVAVHPDPETTLEGPGPVAAGDPRSAEDFNQKPEPVMVGAEISGGDPNDPERFVPMTDDEMEAELDRIESEEDAELDSGDEYDDSAEEDPVEMKLRRVQMLRDENDEAGARTLLYEVLAEGDEDQRNVARNILDQLDT